MTEWSQWRHEWGRKSEKINVGIFPVFFHGVYRFCTFSCISRASVTILSPFFHCLPFFFVFIFSPLEIFMKKYFREGEWGVFTSFLENGTIFVSQGRFSKFFRGVSFFSSPHQPVSNGRYIFSVKGLFSFLADISVLVQKPCFFCPKFFFFFVNCVYFHIGQCMLFSGFNFLPDMFVFVVGSYLVVSSLGGARPWRGHCSCRQFCRFLRLFRA